MNYNIVASKVTGIGHIDLNMPCQDNFDLYQDEEVVVIALADGAGSAKFSDIGSSIATRTLINVVKEDFDFFLEENEEYSLAKKILTRIEHSLQEELEKKKDEFFLSHTQIGSMEKEDVLNQETTQQNLNEEMDENKGMESGALVENKQNDCPFRIQDFASTLLFVAIKGNRYISGHLGDGIIGVLEGEDGNNQKKIGVLSHPENGEYANETFFTTSKDAERHFRINSHTLTIEKGFILMSDGAGESFYQNKTKELIPLVKQIMEDARDVEKLGEVQENVNVLMETRVKQRTKDDCSIIYVVKKHWFDS